MTTLVNVVQVLLTLLFIVSGLAKLMLPYTRFTELPAQEWSTEFNPGHVRLIGLLEVGAAIGMIAVLWFEPSASFTFGVAIMALVMAGAMTTHLRRGEYPNMVGNLAWLALALFVAYQTSFGFAG